VENNDKVKDWWGDIFWNIFLYWIFFIVFYNILSFNYPFL
jgi:hypothetical protein